MYTYACIYIYIYIHINIYIHIHSYTHTIAISESHPKFVIVGARDKPGARTRQGCEHARGASIRECDRAPGVLAPLACSRPWLIPSPPR